MAILRQDNTQGVSAAAAADAAAARRWLAGAAALMVLAAVAAAYSNSFRGPFLLDDEPCIVDNPSIRSFQPIWGPLKTPSDRGIVGRPVVNLTLAINYAVSGLNVWSYHAFNVAIHALAALVLFGLLRRTLLLPVMRGRFERVANALATAVALLWAVHPLQTQAVTYVIQRCESLMGLLFLLTLYCLLRGATSRRAVVWYVASAAACAAGMGCKAVMATAPVLAMVYDGFFLTGSFRESLKRRWGLYLALAATWGLLAALLLGAPGYASGFDTKASPLAYALTQLWVVPHYLLLTFWPGRLVLDYGLTPITDWHRLLAPGLVVIALLAATGIALWRARLWGFLGLWFFLILAPTSSIVPVPDAMFEHRMYLPLAAVAALVVVGGYLLGRRALAWRKAPAAVGWAVAAVLVAAAVVAEGARTYLRNIDYRTALAIWQDTVAKRPENPRALSNLGVQLLAAGRPAEAKGWLDRAIELRPDYSTAYNNRGNCYRALGQSAMAIRDYDRVIELRPNYATPYNNRGNCYQDLGRLADALADYDKTIELRPGFVEAYYNRGACYRALEQFDPAIRDYDRAIELDPRFAAAYNDRGRCYRARGQIDRAMQDYARAIAIDPHFAEAYGNRSNCYKDQGLFADALRDHDKAIELRPDHAEAYFNRGNCLQAMSQFALAIRDYDRAIALDRQLAAAYVNRANCYRAQGRFDLAIDDYGRAIAINPNSAEAHHNRGVTYNDLGRYDQAVADFDRAIDLKPDYAKAYGNRAEAHFQLKHYDQAWADVEQCRRRGDSPSAEFLKRLSEATGRSP